MIYAVFNKEDLSMGYYFQNEQAISMKTQDIRTVLKTVANRYIGQNPPFGVSYYAYQKNGIRQDKHYRFVFDFHNLYPLADLESNVYAWSKLWSDDDITMVFEIHCFGPVIIYCNGERVFKPNVLAERIRDLSSSFSVKLKKGLEQFCFKIYPYQYRLRRSFGCRFIKEPASEFHHPVCRQGRAEGWLYIFSA